MFKRNLHDKLKNMLSWSPVVLLTGARQTGKTTLIKSLCKEEYTYVTFDDLTALALAKNNPMGFIAGLKKPVILDEIQRVPELFLAIKKDVDKNRHKGRYILTGSANPLLIPQVGDSLTGRIEIAELLPFSQGELLGVKETFIDTLFKGIIPTTTLQESTPTLFHKIFIGGYPVVVTEQEFGYERIESWFASYVTTLIQRDIKDLAHISGITELPLLLKLLAARAGNLLNVSNLSREAKIPNSTLHRYLALFETVFLVHLLPAWSRNSTTRLVKSPKVYLNDTGLLSFLLGLRPDQNTIPEGMIAGQLLENFVINELKKQAGWSEKRVTLSYYRTMSGIEVDLVLEDGQGNIVALEVKSSSTVGPRDFKGLEHLQELMGEKFLCGLVLYTGEQTVHYNQKLAAVPISCLWTL